MTDISNYTLITVNELAETLNVSLNSAYTLLKTGQIRSWKIGRHYKIPSTAVDDYIQKMTGLPIPQ